MGRRSESVELVGFFFNATSSLFCQEAATVRRFHKVCVQLKMYSRMVGGVC